MAVASSPLYQSIAVWAADLATMVDVAEALFSFARACLFVQNLFNSCPVSWWRHYLLRYEASLLSYLIVHTSDFSSSFGLLTRLTVCLLPDFVFWSLLG